MTLRIKCFGVFRRKLCGVLGINYSSANVFQIGVPRIAIMKDFDRYSRKRVKFKSENSNAL